MNGWRLALVGGMVGFAPAVAFAHAHLSSAAPAENTTVAAPGQVSLGFTEALERSFSTIEVQDSAGRRVDEGAYRTEADPARLTVGLPKLPGGVYKVIWHATSVDTHRTEGSFTFTVAP